MLREARSCVRGELVRLSVVFFLLYPTLMITRGDPLRARLGGTVRKGGTRVKVTIVVSKRSAVAVGGSVRCPVVDIFGFRRTLTLTSYVRRRGRPLGAQLLVGGSSLGPSACDPLQRACPRKKVRVDVTSLLGCALRRDSGGTYSVLFGCRNNPSTIGGCLRSLKVHRYTIVRARGSVRRGLRFYCRG